MGVAGLGALARTLSIPYPIVLVIGGALFGFVPGVPEVKLDPEVVLVIFLPPLLYSAAFFANLGDIRANLRGIALTSVGLVLLTMAVDDRAVHEAALIAVLVASLPMAVCSFHDKLGKWLLDALFPDAAAAPAEFWDSRPDANQN